MDLTQLSLSINLSFRVRVRILSSETWLWSVPGKCLLTFVPHSLLIKHRNGSHRCPSECRSHSGGGDSVSSSVRYSPPLPLSPPRPPPRPAPLPLTNLAAKQTNKQTTTTTTTTKAPGAGLQDGSWRKVLEGEALAECAWYGRVQLRSINNRRTLFFMMRQSPSTFESNVPENGAQNVLIRLSYRGTRHRG